MVDVVIDPNMYTYIRDERNVLVRSDGCAIPEFDPNNVGYKIYLEWLKLGNKEPPKRSLELPPHQHVDPNIYSYTRNEQDFIIRSDGIYVPENDPNNIVYHLYLHWLELGYPAPPKKYPDRPPAQWIPPNGD